MADALAAKGTAGDDTPPPQEEIRFSLVLNGGVSLAVWMGGAVLEVHRLTQEDGLYRNLMRLLNVKARADVIAGTSAGGINGAALAMAQVNDQADLRRLRDLWAEQGRMESLLQRPFQGAPASLLQGDGYFLPQLYRAMHQLVHPFRLRDTPVDLTITTTLLTGSSTVTVDAFGQRLPQMRHDGTFHFAREQVGDQTPDPDQPPNADQPSDSDDFNPVFNPHIDGQLALAARCTAGFPLAFEPSFVPGKTPADGTELQRPDMSARASWREAGQAGRGSADRSRFAVDGGVLANTPTRNALQVIDRLPAAVPVQRVMLLVYPHAPEDVPDEPDREDAPPSVTGTLGGLLGALTSQGSRTFVEEVEQHNRLAASRRGTRADILGQVLSAEDLEHLAATVYPHYRSLPIRRAARAWRISGRLVACGTARAPHRFVRERASRVGTLVTITPVPER